MSDIKITPLPPPNMAGVPVAEFNLAQMEGALWSKGYDIIREKAIVCPCGDTIGNPDPTCEHCNGLGYIFTNPVLDRAIMTSLNESTKYKEWSIDKSGIVNFTIRNNTIPVTFYDRITIKDCYSHISENRSVDSVRKFCWLTFEPIEIESVHIMDAAGKPVLVPKEKYSISTDNKYVLVFDDTVEFTNGIASVYYQHKIQYYVIDIIHDIRSSAVKDPFGNLSKIDLPLNAVAKRANQFIGEKQVFNDTGTR